MSQQKPNGKEDSAAVVVQDQALGEHEALLDAAIEATFPASDPLASFDFR